MSNTIDVCQTGYDYEQFQLNELENENMKLKKQLEIASKALEYYAQCKHINLDLITIQDGCEEFEAFEDGEHARKSLKEMEGVK